MTSAWPWSDGLDPGLHSYFRSKRPCCCGNVIVTGIHFASLLISLSVRLYL